ncbi:TonB-dependent receptor [Nitrospirillum sp. BR 11752]|uniref:TonB-dependent receptor n=1 Tax=Nitrospirillum sp. BR 11752 TaxID=3104293 RepID=UPI002EAA0414|nr:TonB-dependent receptor [Nitrospirillum sp. BR 11752]
MAVGAGAQAADDPQGVSAADTNSDMQEIVVSGIRKSIASAAERKRDADLIMDSIAQEDLGKFPDANVAESLQRVPGISIDRSSGEGQKVTVRGLGPQFNTVLFNGRTLANDSYGRDFSFDLLPAELISGADTYKTSVARVQEGAIGATINLHTARPFDLPGPHGVVALKENFETAGDDKQPQAFALLSDTFAQDKLGVLASVSYQKRSPSINSVTSDGYLPNVAVGPSSAPLYQDVYAPRNINVNNSLDHRERLGATLVGQFKPNSDLTITVDGLYDHFKDDADNKSLGLWFEPSQYTAATINSNRTVTSLTTSGHADMINQSSLRDTSTYEGGLNADWQATDTLHVVLDATASRAHNDGAGKSFFTVTGVPTTYSFTEGPVGELPSVFGFTPGATTNTNGAYTHLAQRSGNDVVDRVTETKLDLDWTPDYGLFHALRGGFGYTDRKRTTFSAGTLNVNCLYCGYPTLTPSSLLSTFTVKGLGGNLPTSFLAYDPNAYLAYLSSPAALSALDAAQNLAPGTSAANLQSQSQGNGFNSVANPADFVQEKVYAAYAETDFKGKLYGVDWLLNLGARYVVTDMSAGSQSRALVDLLPVTNDPTIYNAVYQNNGQYVPVSASHRYYSFLPDFNLTLKPTSDTVVRLAGSQTLTRPNLGDLRPVTSYDVLRPADMELSGGNPDLKPYKSTNFDISVEWYPTQTTMLSGALFNKDIKDYIVTTIETETVTIANSGNLPVGGFITGPHTASFAAARPHNLGKVNVQGAEVNLVHTFDWMPHPFDGFGVQLNATFVTTDRTFGNMSPNVRFAIVGLSNSQNATLFYEKYGLSARIAYNHRGGFLSSISQGYGGEPLFVMPYGQVDTSISYEIMDGVQILFEGTNITDEKYVTTARYSNQLRGWYDYGARYDIGVRYKF